MGEFAERQTSGGAEAPVIRELSTPLYEARGWIKFIGILSIVGGVLSVFTIWGIIVCWLPIWIGILLLKVGSSIEAAHQSGDRAALMTGMAKLKTCFIIYGILAIVGIVAAAITLVVAGGAMLMALRGGMGGA